MAFESSLEMETDFRNRVPGEGGGGLGTAIYGLYRYEI